MICNRDWNKSRILFYWMKTRIVRRLVMPGGPGCQTGPVFFGELVAFPHLFLLLAISRLYTSLSCVNTLQSMYSMLDNIFCSVFHRFQNCWLVPQVSSSSDNQIWDALSLNRPVYLRSRFKSAWDGKSVLNSEIDASVTCPADT